MSALAGSLTASCLRRHQTTGRKFGWEARARLQFFFFGFFFVLGSYKYNILRMQNAHISVK
jgi:hypothetical protein